MALQQRLDEYQAQARAKRSPERQAIMDWATEDLRRSGIADRCLKAGDAAAAFALPNGAGEIVRSGELLSRGPLVVSFYRGGW